jgi:8-amino-7-oxononanoate synthase
MQWMDDELADRREQDLLRVRPRLESAQGVRVRLGGQEFVSFASNDYLNLAADPRLARAAARAAKRFGCGAGASPLVTGCLPQHRLLERDLARWERTEAALVFSSGFAANLATVSALASTGDAIFSDALNHASIIDGCRLSHAQVHVYDHADACHLDRLLRAEGNRARRRLIVTDTVFSMEGDFAPLAELIELAERYDCLLLLDEAHATGVFGEKGRGITELLSQRTDRNPQRTMKVGTLSKALGSQGGFVCGTRRQIAWLINQARPYIYSTALSPPVAAAARRALKIVEAEPGSRQRLLQMAARLREQLCGSGIDAGHSQSQIIPVVVGESYDALQVAARLKRSGLLVPAIRPPSVPQGTARLRVSLTAGHTDEDVSRLVAALQENRRYLSGSGRHAQSCRADRIP